MANTSLIFTHIIRSWLFQIVEESHKYSTKPILEFLHGSSIQKRHLLADWENSSFATKCQCSQLEKKSLRYIFILRLSYTMRTIHGRTVTVNTAVMKKKSKIMKLKLQNKSKNQLKKIVLKIRYLVKKNKNAIRNFKYKLKKIN